MTRSTLLGSVVLLAAGTSCAGAGGAPGEPSKLLVYVGTYTGGENKGIHLLDLDLATGALGNPRLAGEAANPSFLAIHPGRKFLYAVSEISTLAGKKTGGVSAFSIDPKSGGLRLLNQQPSEGAGPCHLVVDKAGKNVLVANYGGGSVAVIPIQEDGKLAPPSSSIQHAGSSVNPGRQKEPHAHSINLDPANLFAFAADLGLDKVLIYKFDAARGRIEPNNPPHAAVAPGSGPRHFAFHPGGRHAYVINEILSTLTAFTYDAAKGELKELQTLSTLPPDAKGGNSTAEVVVSPDGNFVFGSNRGHDSIAIFAVDAGSGKLSPAGHASTQGKSPRNFIVDPTGKYLLAANQGSDSIVVFRIDPKTGALTPTGHTAKVPKPVCLRTIPAE